MAYTISKHTPRLNVSSNTPQILADTWENGGLTATKVHPSPIPGIVKKHKVSLSGRVTRTELSGLKPEGSLHKELPLKSHMHSALLVQVDQIIQ